MKQYPKTYEDLYRQKEEVKLSRIEAYDGDTPGLVEKFREFFSVSFKDLFEMAFIYLWLEKQITYNGERRIRRWGNGNVPDQTFGRFMAQEIGSDQAMLTRSKWFHVATYFVAEYFPDFLEHNPEDEPEYFKWPYEHVTLDFYAYIYQVENSRELMDYAEEQEMRWHDFKNWVNNYVLSYNEEQGKQIYSIGRSRDGIAYIKNAGWERFPLDAIYEATKKTKAGSN